MTTPTLPSPRREPPRATTALTSALMAMAAFQAVKAALDRREGRAHLAAVPEGMTLLEPAPTIAGTYR